MTGAKDSYRVHGMSNEPGILTLCGIRDIPLRKLNFGYSFEPDEVDCPKCFYKLGGHRLQLRVGPEIYRFNTAKDWEENKHTYRNGLGIMKETMLAIDAKGFVCAGEDGFDRAARQNSFPVIVYKV